MALERGKTWRDSMSFAAVEFMCFVGIFVAGTYNYLPISHTPYLLVLAWLMLFVRGKRWADVGLSWPDHARSAIALGLVAGAVLSVNELIVVEPIVRSFTEDSPDLSLFKELRGNLQATLLLIALSWVLAAFGEEMVWRGYAMTRVAEVMGGSAGAWALSLVLVSVAFGIAHDYQALSGIIITAFGGITYGVLYLLAGRNLLVPIMAHGAQNTCDLLFIYHGGLIPGT
jgi:uncharacterized protein